MTPKGSFVFKLQDMVDKKGEPILTAPGDGHIVYIATSEQVNNAEYGLLMRFISE